MEFAIQSAMTTIAEILARNIRAARLASGLTQAALAGRLSVQPQTINRWETAKTWPGADDVEAIARVLRVSASSLYAPGKSKKAPAPKVDTGVREALSLIANLLGFSLVPRRTGRPRSRGGE